MIDAAEQAVHIQIYDRYCQTLDSSTILLVHTFIRTSFKTQYENNYMNAHEDSRNERMRTCTSNCQIVRNYCQCIIVLLHISIWHCFSLSWLYSQINSSNASFEFVRRISAPVNQTCIALAYLQAYSNELHPVCAVFVYNLIARTFTVHCYAATYSNIKQGSLLFSQSRLTVHCMVTLYETALDFAMHISLSSKIHSVVEDLVEAQARFILMRKRATFVHIFVSYVFEMVKTKRP